MNERTNIMCHLVWATSLNVVMTTASRNIRVIDKRTNKPNLQPNGLYSLHSLAVTLNDSYKNPKPMNNLTSFEEIIFNRARLCHICEKPFTKEDKRVRDHCHFTGK